MTYINQEQLQAANRATVDALLALANTALASAERISSLNLNAARSTIEDSASGARAVLEARSPAEAFAAQNAQVQPALERVMAYSRSAHEISSEAQQEVARFFQEQFAQFQKSLGEMLEKTAKAAPAGSTGAVSAMQSALDAANNTFANMNALSKQFIEMAQANAAGINKASTTRKRK